MAALQQPEVMKDPKAQTWFLTMLVRDLDTLDEYAKAAAWLAKARALVALTGDKRDHFFLEVEAGALASNRDKPEEARSLLLPLLPQMAEYHRQFPSDTEFTILLSRAYRALGGVCNNLGKFQEAILAYDQGQKASQEAGDARGQTRILYLIGMVYSLLGRFDDAIASHKAAIAKAEAMHDLEIEASAHLSFANALGIMGSTEQELAELNSAWRLAVQTQDADIQATASVNLADVYLRRKDYKAALKLADHALKKAAEAHNPTAIAICRVNRGIALNRLGHAAEGLKSLQEGRDYLKNHHMMNDFTETTGNLAEEYAFSGAYRNAYETELQFKALSDSLKKSEDLKRIAEASATFESDKRQLQIDALERERRIQAKLRMLWIALGILGFGVAGVLVVSRKKLQRANRALADMSLRDPLTSLANRRYLATRISEDLAQVHRMQRQIPDSQARWVLNIDVTFLMIDIDHFKEVNDLYGHAAGDRVLKQFAELLVQTMRDSDTVVRWGGEEFLVVAKPTAQREAYQVAERIRTRVEAYPFDLGEGRTLHRTCSVGFSSYPFYRDNPSRIAWEQVAEVSDQCLYAAKAMGRNTWVGVHEAEGAPPSDPEAIQKGLDVPARVQDGTLRAESRGDQPIQWVLLPGHGSELLPPCAPL